MVINGQAAGVQRWQCYVKARLKAFRLATLLDIIVRYLVILLRLKVARQHHGGN
jgi:hypothetical protein